jgi:hypothetical protein
MSIPLSSDQFEKKPNPYTPRRRIRLDRIDATQRYWDQAKVDDIARRGPKVTGITPIVGKIDGRYKSLDGHHRLAAQIQNGETHTSVMVIK